MRRANLANGRLESASPAAPTSTALTRPPRRASRSPYRRRRPIGGPIAPDGAYERHVSSVLFVTPTRTLGLELVAVADADADLCSVDGMAVPS